MNIMKLKEETPNNFALIRLNLIC